MRARRDDEELPRAVPLDCVSEAARLRERPEPADRDPLATCRLRFHMDEEMPFRRRGSLDHLDETAVALELEGFKATPLEPPHAQDQARCPPFPVEAQAGAFAPLASRKDENRLGLLGLPADV